MKKMIITFFNKKGGVGKTSLSYNVARDLDFYLLSNDDSVIAESYEKAKVLKEIELYKGENIIYDLGGFVDKNAIEVLKASDLIVVPTIGDINSLKRTVNTVKELQEFNKKILVIGNIVKPNDQDFISKFVNAQFFIRESKVFQNTLIEEKSISDLVQESKFNEYRYRNIYKDYVEFLNFIKTTIGLKLD